MDRCLSAMYIACIWESTKQVVAVLRHLTLAGVHVAVVAIVLDSIRCCSCRYAARDTVDDTVVYIYDTRLVYCWSLD